jgi:hypothetical protein
VPKPSSEMAKFWTRASDMAGAPLVIGGSVLVGGAEAKVGQDLPGGRDTGERQYT